MDGDDDSYVFLYPHPVSSFLIFLAPQILSKRENNFSLYKINFRLVIAYYILLSTTLFSVPKININLKIWIPVLQKLSTQSCCVVNLQLLEGKERKRGGY